MSECGIAMPGAFGYVMAALRKWGAEHRAPISMTYELTPCCNFRCPMCYVRLTPEQARARGQHLTTEQWLEVIRQSKEMGTLAVNITGGEALLYPGFWEVYEAAVKAGMYVNLLSNGYLIDEAVVERFKQLPPQGVIMSLYGGSDETYETMCGVKRGFTRIDHAIDLLKAANIPVSLTLMVIKENKHDLETVLRYASEKGVLFDHVEGIAGSSSRGADTDPTSSSNMLSHVNEVKWPLDKLEQKKHAPISNAFQACRYYGGNCVISWLGRMQFCTFTDKHSAPLTFPLDLRAVWNQMLEQTDRIQVPAACADCDAAEFCNHCPGVLASYSGDPEEVSEQFCARPKAYAALYRRLRAEAAAAKADAAEAAGEEKTAPAD